MRKFTARTQGRRWKRRSEVSLPSYTDGARHRVCRAPFPFPEVGHVLPFRIFAVGCRARRGLIVSAGKAQPAPKDEQHRRRNRVPGVGRFRPGRRPWKARLPQDRRATRNESGRDHKATPENGHRRLRKVRGPINEASRSSTGRWNGSRSVSGFHPTLRTQWR